MQSKISHTSSDHLSVSTETRLSKDHTI